MSFDSTLYSHKIALRKQRHKSHITQKRNELVVIVYESVHGNTPTYKAGKLPENFMTFSGNFVSLLKHVTH